MATKNLYGLGDYSPDQIKEFASVLQEEQMDPAQAYYRRPDGAPDPVAAIKNMPLSETSAIIPDAFAGQAGATLAVALSLPQLQEIGAEGDVYLKQAVKIAFSSAVQQSPTDEHLRELAEHINQSPAWQ